MSFTSVPRWRDVYIAAGARAISVGGDFLAATALLLAFQDKGLGGFTVAALLIAEAVPLVLFAPLGGWLADRYDSRAILVTVGLLQAGLCAALAGMSNPWLLVAAIFLLTCGVAVTGPTWSALTPEMVGRDNMPRASAIGQTGNAVGMLTGPALAGLLFGIFGGARVPLLVDAATFLAITFGAMIVHTRRNLRASGSSTATPTAGSGSGYRLRRDPMVLAIVVTLVSVIAVLSAVNVADVFFVRGHLHATATLYGIITASWAGGIMIGSWLVAGREWSDGRWAKTMLGILALLCLVLLGFSQAPVAWLLLPLSIIGGAFNGALNVTAGVVPARRVPNAVRGRVFGRIQSSANAANVIGYVAGGLLVGPIAAQHVIAYGSVAGALVVVAMLPLVTRAIRLDSAASPIADASTATGVTVAPTPREKISAP
jgi:MFS family permease